MNTFTQSRLCPFLAYAGAIPFVACAVMMWMGQRDLAGILYVEDVLIVYGLVIATFLNGVHWGTYLYQSERSPLNLFITSNVVTIAIWLVFMTTTLVVTLISQMIAFAILLLIDWWLLRAAVIPASYFRLRFIVTVIVVVSLLAVVLQA